MRKNKWQTKLKLERMPCASAAAILSSSLCAFIFTGIPGTHMEEASVHLAMLLCAVFTAVLELAALPNSVLLAGCAAFICAGGALLFVPMGAGSIYTAISTDAGVPAARVLTMAMLLCGAVCLAVCVLNRSFALRCIAAGGLLTMLLLFIWLRFGILTVPAILITAYILIVLCQVCSLGMSHTSDAPREMWFVLFSLITAVVVFSLPYPGTRIRWERLLEIRPSGQLEQLGETLDIEPIEPEADGADISGSGYSEDQSSLGGWLELVSVRQLQAEFSDRNHSDRLTGGIYDCYTGSGWICVTQPDGPGYASPCDALSVSDSDLYGSVLISGTEKGSDDEIKRETLFYPPYSCNVVSGDSGEDAVREGTRLVFEQSDSLSYKAYYTDQPCGYELSDDERESLLALPDTLPERVKKLALETTEGCGDDRDKANELMVLLSGYRYSTQVDSLPEDRDFVDHFLFGSKEGYCAYFASAMAVMSRCAGIPARYVQGYYIGTGDALTVTVSSDNAHAWAELYIDGRWVVYDPAASPMDEMIGESADPSDENKPEQDNSALNRILACSYAAIAAAAAVFVVLRPFFRRFSWRMKLKRKHGRNSGYPVIAGCGMLMWVLAACGVKREESETLAEFCARIRRECEWLDEDVCDEISDLFDRVSKVIYSPCGAAEDKRKNIARSVRRRF